MKRFFNIIMTICMTTFMLSCQAMSEQEALKTSLSQIQQERLQMLEYVKTLPMNTIMVKVDEKSQEQDGVALLKHYIEEDLKDINIALQNPENINEDELNSAIEATDALSKTIKSMYQAKLDASNPDASQSNKPTETPQAADASSLFNQKALITTLVLGMGGTALAATIAALAYTLNKRFKKSEQPGEQEKSIITLDQASNDSHAPFVGEIK